MIAGLLNSDLQAVERNCHDLLLSNAQVFAWSDRREPRTSSVGTPGLQAEIWNEEEKKLNVERVEGKVTEKVGYGDRIIWIIS